MGLILMQYGKSLESLNKWRKRDCKGQSFFYVILNCFAIYGKIRFIINKRQKRQENVVSLLFVENKKYITIIKFRMSKTHYKKQRFAHP